MTQVTFAILAGGAATRLGGRDKGLERLHDRPLIGWVIDALGRMDACGASRMASDGKGVAHTSILIIANRNLDVYARHAPTLADNTPGQRGPLAGVATALAACTTPWLVTVPVDCPEPPCDLAARLFDAARAMDASAVVAHDGECRQPLFAIYRRELAASIPMALAAGHGVWQWQTSIGACELDFSDCRDQFRNLNTPEDFSAHANRNDA